MGMPVALKLFKIMCREHMRSVVSRTVRQNIHFIPRNRSFFVRETKISKLTSKVFIIPDYIISI